jgi:hypothetical protein
MVKTRLGMAAICAVLMTTASWAKQIEAAAPLVSTDIIAIFGSEGDARTVIAKVLTDAVAQYHRSEFLLSSQIRREWLPVIQGVNFVLISDADIRGFLSRCGQYWIITGLTRTQNVVTMLLHSKCGGTTRGYSVSFDGKEWQLRQTGIGSGFPMPQPDCPCVGP